MLALGDINVCYDKGLSKVCVKVCNLLCIEPIALKLTFEF